MEPRRLQQRGVAQRQVEAGAQLLAQQLVAQAHTLAGLLKARRRHGVNDILFLQGTVKGSRLTQNAVGIAALIGVQRGRARPVLQQLRRAGEQWDEGGMVRRYEGAEQFRAERRAVPLVKGKGDKLRLGGAERCLALKEAHG